MPIPIKDDASITDPRQAPYNLSRKDQKAMDDILDPLKKIGLVEDVPLGKPSPVSYPEFVIWREVKARVVVDLRRANTKLQLDAYPLPRQDDILQKLHGCQNFSSFDMTKSFSSNAFSQRTAGKQPLSQPIMVKSNYQSV